MKKKITKSEFERMLAKLFDEQEKLIHSERIRTGIRKPKVRKSPK